MDFFLKETFFMENCTLRIAFIYELGSIISLSTNSVAFSDGTCLSGGGSVAYKKSKHLILHTWFCI